MTRPTTEKPPNPVEEDRDSDSDESDDEDYVPDAKDDIPSDGEDESDGSDNERGNYPGETGSEYSTTRSGKRRKGGDVDSSFSNKHRIDDAIDEAEAQRKKTKLDALWAEMNTPASKRTSRSDLFASSAAGVSTMSGGGSNEGSGKMITITTSYDFAGETVTVTKDVFENSKEAKDHFRKQNKNPQLASASKATFSTEDELKQSSVSSSNPQQDTTPTASSNSSLHTPKVASIPDSEARKLPIRYIRRKSTLDELAATYGVKKPPKMNTLEKSKLDWNAFVGKEGIEDELKHHNKDGYMEKVAFLQRTDERRDKEYQTLKKKK
ncbi:Craniofacial development protein 1 [Gryganskiella cystojenkinii]|nr:Craniofacial development protein 1 [Gryganskiella cystojenkinii]